MTLPLIQYNCCKNTRGTEMFCKLMGPPPSSALNCLWIRSDYHVNCDNSSLHNLSGHKQPKPKYTINHIWQQLPLFKSAHFLFLQNPTQPLLCLSYPNARLSESSSKSKPLPSKPTSKMISLSSPSSSVFVLSIPMLPQWTTPTTCSTKFPNQTLWSSTPWPVAMPAPIPLFEPLCFFLIFYALA